MISSCRARLMTKSDLRMVREWRNHPDVRRWMISQHEISEDEHSAWFDRIRGDSKKTAIIVEHCEQPIGFVQFCCLRTQGTVEWGFYAKPLSKRGTGLKLGMAAIEYAFKEMGVKRIVAQILAANEVSINFHRRLGFVGELSYVDELVGRHSGNDFIYFSLDEFSWRKSLKENAL